MTGEGPASLVLVHGAWGGSWIWERVLPLLEAQGVEATTVDLPSCGAGSAEANGLRRDEDAVRDALDRTNGAIVLCGHSYGGMPITGGAFEHPRVRRLLYLCAFMPAEGESLLGMFGNVVPAFWRIHDDLTVLPERDEKALRAGELGPEEELRLAALTVPQTLTSYLQIPSGIAWRTIPSTYAICTDDESLPTEFQRTLAPRASDVVELPTGHRPMLTHPELTTELLCRLAGSSQRATTRSVDARLERRLGDHVDHDQDQQRGIEAKDHEQPLHPPRDLRRVRPEGPAASSMRPSSGPTKPTPTVPAIAQPTSAKSIQKLPPSPSCPSHHRDAERDHANSAGV